jgi:hypothetical protein
MKERREDHIRDREREIKRGRKGETEKERE